MSDYADILDGSYFGSNEQAQSPLKYAEGLTKQDASAIINDPRFLNDAIKYYWERDQKLFDSEEEVIDYFFNDRRWRSTNTASIALDVKDAYTQPTQQAQRLGRLERVYQAFPNPWEEGGRPWGEVLCDVGPAILSDPLNLIGFGSGAVAARAAGAAASTSKQALMAGMKAGAKRGAWTEGLASGGIELGADAMIQARDQELGLQDEYSIAQGVLSTFAGTALGGAAGGIFGAVGGARKGRIGFEDQTRINAEAAEMEAAEAARLRQEALAQDDADNIFVQEEQKVREALDPFRSEYGAERERLEQEGIDPDGPEAPEEFARLKRTVEVLEGIENWGRRAPDYFAALQRAQQIADGATDAKPKEMQEAAVRVDQLSKVIARNQAAYEALMRTVDEPDPRGVEAAIEDIANERLIANQMEERLAITDQLAEAGGARQREGGEASTVNDGTVIQSRETGFDTEPVAPATRITEDMVQGQPLRFQNEQSRAVEQEKLDAAEAEDIQKEYNLVQREYDNALDAVQPEAEGWDIKAELDNYLDELRKKYKDKTGTDISEPEPLEVIPDPKTRGAEEFGLEEVDTYLADEVETDVDASPIKVGDEVQWTSEGVDQFPEGKRKITQIFEDEGYATVEGSETGIPLTDLNKVRAEAPVSEPKVKKRKPRKRKTPEEVLVDEDQRVTELLDKADLVGEDLPELGSVQRAAAFLTARWGFSKKEATEAIKSVFDGVAGGSGVKQRKQAALLDYIVRTERGFEADNFIREVSDEMGRDIFSIDKMREYLSEATNFDDAMQGLVIEKLRGMVRAISPSIIADAKVRENYPGDPDQQLSLLANMYGTETAEILDGTVRLFDEIDPADISEMDVGDQRWFDKDPEDIVADIMNGPWMAAWINAAKKKP